MIIAVDFDGTIVEHKYPYIGKEKPFAIETLKQMAADGHRLILWTVRSGKRLQEALEWCENNGLRFYAVNSNLPYNSPFAANPNDSPKIKADFFIDDNNIGGLPDWGEIYEMVCEKEKIVTERRKRRKQPWLVCQFRRLWKLK